MDVPLNEVNRLISYAKTEFPRVSAEKPMCIGIPSSAITEWNTISSSNKTAKQKLSSTEILSNLTYNQAMKLLKRGDHVISRLSHGVYDGSGFVYTLRGGKVCRLSLKSGFPNGASISIIKEPSAHNPDQIVARAKSRLGWQENHREYKDSESFVFWCRCSKGGV